MFLISGVKNLLEQKSERCVLFINGWNIPNLTRFTGVALFIMNLALSPTDSNVIPVVRSGQGAHF